MGLPLGSPRPGNIPALPDQKRLSAPTKPTAEPDPVDVTAQKGAVRAFLESAVAATGVAAEVATGSAPCPDDSGTTQATASVVVPVVTATDDAQVPFDATTRTWTDVGLAQNGCAMGRDYWAPRASRQDGVTSASIRGTVDGLSLPAGSACAR